MSAEQTVSTAEAATFLGCDVGTIYNLEAAGRIAPREIVEHGRRRLRRFCKADLVPLKEERSQNLGKGAFRTDRGKAYTISRGAKEFDLPSAFVRECTKETRLLPEGRLEILKWPAGASDSAKPRGYRSWGGKNEAADRGLTLVLGKDLFRLKNAVRVALKKGRSITRNRWKTVSEIVTHLGTQATADHFEVVECLKCWRERGLLGWQTVLTRISGKAPSSWTAKGDSGARTFHDLRPVEKLRETIVYDLKHFLELWEADYLSAGVKALRDLLTEARKDHKEVKAAEAGERLAKLGIAGRRLRRVVKQANVRARRAVGPGKGCYLVYEFATRPDPKTRLPASRRCWRAGPSLPGKAFAECEHSASAQSRSTKREKESASDCAG